MGKFLHSLPWTLALALAQAGESGDSGITTAFREPAATLTAPVSPVTEPEDPASSAASENPEKAASETTASEGEVLDA